MSESTTNGVVGFFQVAWMPRIHLTFWKVCIDTYKHQQSLQTSRAVANEAAAAVPQAMAVLVGLLGWVTSGKGVRGNLLCGALPETRAVTRISESSLSKQTKHLPHLTLHGLGSEGN